MTSVGHPVEVGLYENNPAWVFKPEINSDQAGTTVSLLPLSSGAGTVSAFLLGLDLTSVSSFSWLDFFLSTCRISKKIYVIRQTYHNF